MDIGEESPMIVIEPIETPVPGYVEETPPEPDYEETPIEVEEEELVPA